MKEFEVSSNGNSQPYPMYFTLRGKDGVAEGQIIHGTAVATIAHIKPVEVGDSIRINGIVHVISEITDTQKPKGKHHPDALLYAINTTYKRVVNPR